MFYQSSAAVCFINLFAFTLCMLGNFHVFFLSADFFFQIYFFRKFLSEIPLECQPVWIQFRHVILSGLTWAQIVCKGYQQTSHADKEVAKPAFVSDWNVASVEMINISRRGFIIKTKELNIATVLPAKSDSYFMVCLQSHQGLIIDSSLVY